MSYANSGSGRERIAAIGLVGLIQGGIIAALISGLAVQFVTEVPEPALTTYDAPNDPLPPPPDVKPPEAVKPLETAAIPLPVAPTPIVPIDVPRPSVAAVDVNPQPSIDVPPTPLPSARVEPAPATNLARGAATRGSVADWFPRRDYPAAALRAGAEGRVSVMLTVSSAGRATGCEVVSGSGDASLDAATCRLALRNGRFEAARDAAGTPDGDAPEAAADRLADRGLSLVDRADGAGTVPFVR